MRITKFQTEKWKECYSYEGNIPITRNKNSHLQTTNKPSINVWNSTVGFCKKQKTNINTLQSFQSINLRLLTNVPWYVSNLRLDKDLKIQTITTLAIHHYEIVHNKTSNYLNLLIFSLHSLTNSINFT